LQGSAEVRALVLQCLNLWGRQLGVAEKLAEYDSFWLQFFGSGATDEFLIELREIVRVLSLRKAKNGVLRRHRLNENELRVLSLASTIAAIEPSGPKPWKVLLVLFKFFGFCSCFLQIPASMLFVF
jgi:hypothetical protein